MRFRIQKAARPSRAKKSDYAALHRIADAATHGLKTKILNGMLRVRHQVSVKDIIQALARPGDKAEAIAASIPWHLMFEHHEIDGDLAAVAAAAALHTTGRLVRIAKDSSKDLAVAWAREHSSELIQGISDESKAAVRVAVSDTIDRGVGYEQSAQQIKDAVGLSERQAQAVSRYRTGLEETGVRPDIVDRRTEAYAERLLINRAETISRTETIAAASQGQLQAWEQAAADGLIRKDSGKTWLVTPDDLACPICQGLDGVTIPRDEMFQTDFGPVDAPPAHPNCRCAMTLEI